MNTHGEQDASVLPLNINMVGGTMPGLMFYAGFMEILGQYESVVNLKSLSGTSAGAFIAAMTTVGKSQEVAQLIMDEFGDNTGKVHDILQRITALNRAGLDGQVGMIGEKTIQQNLGNLLDKHVSEDDIIESDIRLKTLHMRRKKGIALRNIKESDSPYAEACWLLRTVAEDKFRSGLSKITGGFLGADLGAHEVFDSKSSELIKKYKGRVLDIVSGSFKYSPVELNDEEVITDGEYGSRHEGNNSSIMLAGDVGEKEKLLVLTRFREGEGDFEQIQNELHEAYPNHDVTVLGPSEKLHKGIINVEPEFMEANLEIGRQTALLYLEVLSTREDIKIPNIPRPDIETIRV